MTAKTLVLGIIKRNYLALYRYFGDFCIKLPYNRKQTITNQGVRQYPPPQKIKIMSNKSHQQPKLIYQVETSDLEQLIFRAVADAMSQHSSSNTQVVAESSEMLSREEAAKFLHVSKQTLANWERMNYLIPVRAGRRVLYPVELLRQFTNTNNK